MSDQQLKEIPKTMEDAVRWIVKGISSEEREKVRQELATPKGADRLHAGLHHTYGMYLRNTLQLWHPPSAELRKDIWEKIGPERRSFYDAHWSKYGDQLHQAENMHADDASSELIDAAFEVLRKGL